MALFFISVVSFVQFSKPENENNSNDIPRPAAMLSCKSLGRIYAPIRVAHYRRHSREQPYAGLTSRNGHRNYFHLMIALISCFILQSSQKEKQQQQTKLKGNMAAQLRVRRAQPNRSRG